MFCVGADTGGGENDWLLYWWGIAHKCLSMGGRERITTDTLWHYSYNLESRRWKMEIDSPQDPVYYFLSLIDLQPSGVGE